MVNYNGRKIIYTFRHGTCFSMRSKIIYLIGAVFWLALGITQLIFRYYEYMVVAYIYCFVGIMFLVVTVYYFCKARRIDREISKWLKDEHLFEAYAEAYEFEEWYNRGTVYYKLGINFKNNAEKYSQYTSRSESVWRFKKICNLVKSNKLEILYSPKYGEVMVFESEQGK